MCTAKLGNRGRLTVPKDVRDQLGLRPGDKIDFRVEADGTARLLPMNVKVSQIAGMLAPFARGKALSVEEMDEAVARAFREGRL